MAKNRDHYEAFVDDENFEAYIARKRKNDCFGNHLELQAMSEMFARTIEVYVYKVSLPPPTTNTLHRRAPPCTAVQGAQEAASPTTPLFNLCAHGSISWWLATCILQPL